MTLGTLDTLEAPHAPRPKRPSRHTAQGTEDSKHNPFGGTNIQGGYARRRPSFPSDRAAPENERIPPVSLSLSLSGSARRRANGIPPPSSPRNKASPSQHEDYAENLRRSKRGRGVHAKPATGRPVIGSIARRVWLRPPARRTGRHWRGTM
jgi:hypothetical protein